MTFAEAFEKFIKGQVVKSEVEFNYNEIKNSPTLYGYGLAFENGYKVISYGGGSSGYDYNDQYIINPDNEKIAQQEAMSV